MAYKKLDNRSLPAKIAIRRWLLDKMGITQVRLLETCTGGALIWRAMEDYVELKLWTKIDVKPRPGTGAVLKLTATQAINALPLHEYNVIDCDFYGDPWEAYRAVLAHGIRQPLAVFLTHGHVSQAQLSHAAMAAVGMPTDWKIPVQPSVNAYVASRIVARTWEVATIDHAATIEFPHVTYLALALSPLPPVPPPLGPSH